MKKSIYLKLEDIPEADRADYAFVVDKWVLQLDGFHPVLLKNTELLTEKTTNQALHASSIAQKDSEISRLNTELTASKQTQGVQAGTVAIPVADATLLNEYKGLGEIKDVKAKVEEHTTLKEQAETVARQKILSEAAKAHGLNSDAFIALAEPKKLNELLEPRVKADEKGNSITEYFVKTKDAAGADIFTVLNDFVKTDDSFKPFLPSLLAKSEEKEKVKIPGQKTGDPAKDASPADLYLAGAYKQPEKAA
jgi:hypothetical protein